MSTSAPSAVASTEIPPVSLLAGFLGTGKTTTLTHILENRAGLKVGVIVNDVAEVNVDANLISKTIEGEDGLDLIQLENGCVCCGPQAGSLGPAVKQICADSVTRGQPLDHVVIELSGVADPATVNYLLSEHDVEVERVVTLVDSSAFPGMFQTEEVMMQRDDLTGGKSAWEADPCVKDRRVVDLLTTQIESADVMVVNKADLATKDEMDTTMAVCQALNTKATVSQSSFGQVLLEDLLPGVKAPVVVAQSSCCSNPECPSNAIADAAKEAKESAASAMAHDHSHNHDHASDEPHPHEIFSNFVYRADRPFHETRLLSVIDQWPIPTKDVLSIKDLTEAANSAKADPNVDSYNPFDPNYKSPFEQVLRSKGWTWLHRYPATEVFWSHAGRHFALERLPAWGAREIEEGTDQSKQEIVFIGIGMDEERIRELLDDCLLTDREFATFKEQLTRGSRFKVGQEIEAFTPTGWQPGVIVALNYREDDWPDGQIAPYQIHLEDGTLIFAPLDDDKVVRIAPGASVA